MQIFGNDILPIGSVVHVTTDKKKAAIGALIEILDAHKRVINVARIVEIKPAPRGFFRKNVICAKIIA